MALRVNYVARETATNFTRNITLTLATILTVTITLILVGTALLVRQGVANTTLQWRGDVEFIVYMDPAASPDQIASVQSDLDTSPQVDTIDYLDHEAAYDEFLQLFRDDASITEAVVPTDLPTNFKVIPVDRTADVVEALTAQFRLKPGVYSVESASSTIRSLERISGTASAAILVAAVALAGAALALIINTIRLAMFSRRREIEVMKLVGATNWFIRVPFMVEGLIQGIIGSLIGVGVVWGLGRGLENYLANDDGVPLLSNFIVSDGDLLNTSIVLLVVGSCIGLIGSSFAVTRFLDV
ncbi:MAG: ABC transporter permease [Actinomycetota bacterium]|nr:ABC transporter permease [Actinomycetota bacterium]